MKTIPAIASLLLASVPAASAFAAPATGDAAAQPCAVVAYADEEYDWEIYWEPYLPTMTITMEELG
ncbi:hypothetical protein L602_001300000290 [Cupriavidus gilardii J11]|uniref:Uncharacterized protein n=1 Tax=Cupriavidus gilardii J11 TaxID=936133 RepID=A0A562BSV8_9BURK|nr:hypothetical protein [Cupriavidus gilardii]TWG88272.1 hypothetical protein L602_001300000290 [Cupriavidus gilardii J11]